MEENTLIDITLRLSKAKDDTRLLAGLRKCMSPHSSIYIPTLGRLKIPMATPRELGIARIVGWCYGFHPNYTSSGSLGTNLRQLDDGKIDGPMEKRLLRLLRSETIEDVGQNVMTITRMCKSKGIAINIEELYSNLFYWGNKSENLSQKTKWAGDFYNASKK